MQIKITLRLYLIPVRMTMVKKTTVNANKDEGKKDPWYTVGGDVN
jgi:hypothetical protein